MDGPSTLCPDVLAALPHRPPFLFVDAIVESGTDRIRTQRTVRPDEDYFRGHYPGRPLMPGVLICEAMFQTGAILLLRRSQGEANGRVPLLTRVQEVKFRSPVVPGETMDIEVALIEILGPAFFLRGSVRVAGRRVAQADFSVTLVAPHDSPERAAATGDAARTPAQEVA